MARQVGAGLPGALKVMGRKDACDFPSCAGCVWEWGGQEGGRAHAREREVDLNLVVIVLLFFSVVYSGLTLFKKFFN